MEQNGTFRFLHDLQFIDSLGSVLLRRCAMRSIPICGRDWRLDIASTQLATGLRIAVEARKRLNMSAVMLLDGEGVQLLTTWSLL